MDSKHHKQPRSAVVMKLSSKKVCKDNVFAKSSRSDRIVTRNASREGSTFGSEDDNEKNYSREKREHKNQSETKKQKSSKRREGDVVRPSKNSPDTFSSEVDDSYKHKKKDKKLPKTKDAISDNERESSNTKRHPTHRSTKEDKRKATPSTMREVKVSSHKRHSSPRNETPDDTRRRNRNHRDPSADRPSFHANHKEESSKFKRDDFVNSSKHKSKSKYNPSSREQHEKYKNEQAPEVHHKGGRSSEMEKKKDKVTAEKASAYRKKIRESSQDSYHERKRKHSSSTLSPESPAAVSKKKSKNRENRSPRVVSREASMEEMKGSKKSSGHTARGRSRSKSTNISVMSEKTSPGSHRKVIQKSPLVRSRSRSVLSSRSSASPGHSHHGRSQTAKSFSTKPSSVQQPINGQNKGGRIWDQIIDKFEDVSVTAFDKCVSPEKLDPTMTNEVSSQEIPVEGDGLSSEDELDVIGSENWDLEEANQLFQQKKDDKSIAVEDGSKIPPGQTDTVEENSPHPVWYHCDVIQALQVPWPDLIKESQRLANQQKIDIERDSVPVHALIQHCGGVLSRRFADENIYNKAKHDLGEEHVQHWQSDLSACLQLNRNRNLRRRDNLFSYFGHHASLLTSHKDREIRQTVNQLTL